MFLCSPPREARKKSWKLKRETGVIVFDDETVLWLEH